jgi:hypothetical protein
VTFRVENRGNIRMAATPSVAVGGPFGLLGSSVTLPDIPQLLPGERVDLTAELTGVPALVLNSTEVKLVPIGTAGAATVTSSDTTFAPPLALLLVLLAVVLLVLALRARRRRTAPSKIDAPAKSDSEPELAHR